MTSYTIRVHKSYKQMGYKPPMTPRMENIKEAQKESTFEGILNQKLERGNNYGK